MSKFLKWTFGLIAFGLLYNVDAFIGQWKFERLCENEGGSKFYAQVEKDVGWEVESADEKAYIVPFNIGHVAFVRFKDKQGNLHDVYLAPGPTPWSKGYDIRPADMTKQTRYRLAMEQTSLPGYWRMSRGRDVISDLHDGNVVASHTLFSYEWAKPDRMILYASTGVTCHAGMGANDFFSRIFEKLSEQTPSTVR